MLFINRRKSIFLCYNYFGGIMNAYVTFIIKNDSYLPGALVLAYALLKQNTKNDLVCFVSSDVSEEANDTLRKIYNEVIYIDAIKTENKRLNERSDVDELFTRFNALKLDDVALTGSKYNKIVLLDSDILPLRKYDDLFQLEAPAGIINEKKEHVMEWNEKGEFIKPLDLNSWNWHKIYKKYPQGVLIEKEITDRVLADVNNMGINAGLYVLNTSSELFAEIKEDIKKESTSNIIKNFIWPEMQYLTYKLSGQWHNVDIKYASFNGYPDIRNIYGIHFVGVKPWEFENRSIKNYSKFDDFKLWHYTFLEMIKEYPKLKKNKVIKKLYQNITELDSKYELNKDLEVIFKHLKNNI